MIQTFTHPTIEKLLEQSNVEIFCQQSSIEVVFISDYFPNVSPQTHGGLIEAVKFRLFHPSHFIYIASFFPKEKLLPFDTFGILSLTGTEFIQLPFDNEKFFVILKEKQKTEFNLSKVEWEIFAIEACKALLKEKLSVLKHGGKLDFVNNISGPLRAVVVGSLTIPELFPEVLIQLQSIKDYLLNEEIAELFLLAKVGESLSDDFLQSVSQFINLLQQLELYSSIEEINRMKLISEIDELNKLFSKIRSK